MKRIAKLVKMIDDELEGASCYSEKYIEYKADGIMDIAEKYHKLAEDELEHSSVLHDIALDEIEKLNRVFTAPADMVEKWEKSHVDYVNRSAWIRQMLAM